MATEAQKQEIKDKVTRLVDSKYGGDWTKMFTFYAGQSEAPDEVERKELVVLLEDAGIGNWITRGQWADGIMEDLDTSANNKISWSEFNKVLRS